MKRQPFRAAFFVSNVASEKFHLKKRMVFWQKRKPKTTLMFFMQCFWLG
jgi:hypothetical protein